MAPYGPDGTWNDSIQWMGGKATIVPKPATDQEGSQKRRPWWRDYIAAAVGVAIGQAIFWMWLLPTLEAWKATW